MIFSSMVSDLKLEDLPCFTPVDKFFLIFCIDHKVTDYLA